MSQFSRRKFLLTAGGTAAAALWLNACGSNNSSTDTTGSTSTPAPSGTSGGDAPEVKGVTLGFIALTDAAPVIIALEKGLFAKYGLPDTKVVKQTSWAVTRDNLELGSDRGGIDGAHILSPMPYLLTAGTITKSQKPLPMYILARLNTQGQGISLSNEFLAEKVQIKDPKLKAIADQKKASGKLLKAAVTFPGGTHDLWMRYWLAANGIDPNNDADLVVIPPPQMVANMQTGTMDTFCVGEPWNARLVNKKLGYTAAVTGELWKFHPEKALTIRADWADKNPKATMALLKAVQEAQIWCEDPANLDELCQITAQDKYFKTSVEDIKPRLQGDIDYGDGRSVKNSDLRMRFWSENASFPYKSHDLWFLTEDIRWGYLPASTDTKALIEKVNRSDLWREAAKAIGREQDIPASDSRGVETFFDGVTFDPENPQAYLDGLKFKAIKA
ncbi:CmpA/NrtA family ABC transporter substrate-binding protein [Synechococcus elongatus]|uniref:Nitrate/nitrite binding protein NrtA n=2 Tax=Synechococcus elongatus TaxID=32046 RepID=NRTA_SYNE7|nr:CmpA/NrtA family ABC transporter substrate-binding protein [Synechococcus elongatus]P38043.2 RecName: Full=Nitrate/nitrite binding protein NrtA; Flags: Precursor [Synechococcus elongatus PCC 7942 = FACHB-805]pir/JQ2134/ nitrate transport 45K protein - Synechococcus sp [Synechococcus sp.]ABB57269.1 ABC-type nitrate/nitrite transport system substrate-binding protein [Synechococcus elongatus PCC 7942 = FACHB-805]AJD58217.1 bicarbonate-binding protein [Synechococcus elongatus UTEX 2973]MBD25876